jgi:molybdopterin synthase catalytic subunit
LKPKILTDRRIDLERVLAQVQDPRAGGTVLFVGTVRENGEAGKVDLIHYESYESMAEKQLRRIQDEVSKMPSISKVAITHRVGELRVGEVSVAVAVSAPHRAEAFEACRHAVERIKRDVPIWKKERLADGSEVWVEGHQVGAAPKKQGRSR